MRRGVAPVILVIALLLAAGAGVVALNRSGKMIDIRLVDVVTASPTLATLPSPTSAIALVSTAQPTTSPNETQAAIPTFAPTQTQPASPVVVPTVAQATATSVVIATTQAPPTPVVIGGTQAPQPSVSPGGATPTATPTLAPGTIVEYTIQQGDSLSGIALQFDTTVEAITARNHITDPSNILWGFTLQIVVGEQTPPTAQPGASAQPANPGAPTTASAALAPTTTSGPTPSPAH